VRFEFSLGLNYSSTCTRTVPPVSCPGVPLLLSSAVNIALHSFRLPRKRRLPAASVRSNSSGFQFPTRFLSQTICFHTLAHSLFFSRMTTPLESDECALLHKITGVVGPSAHFGPLVPEVARPSHNEAERPVLTTFRMNTCKSVSKQRTLTTFRMNTYAKPGGEGVASLRDRLFLSEGPPQSINARVGSISRSALLRDAPARYILGASLTTRFP